jgi:hypothetical protein
MFRTLPALQPVRSPRAREALPTRVLPSEPIRAGGGDPIVGGALGDDERRQSLDKAATPLSGGSGSKPARKTASPLSDSAVGQAVKRMLAIHDAQTAGRTAGEFNGCRRRRAARVDKEHLVEPWDKLKNRLAGTAASGDTSSCTSLGRSASSTLLELPHNVG